MSTPPIAEHAGQDADSAGRHVHVVAAVAGLAAFGVGAFFLAGWLAIGRQGSEWLGLRMKTNTALVLTLDAAALLLLAWRRRPAHLPAARVLAGVAVLVTLATLLEYATGINLGVDQLIARDFPFADDQGLPNRMAPNTAFALTSLAAALLALPSARPRTAMLGQVAAFVAFAVAVLSLVGYLYGAERLYRPTVYVGMTAFTATALALLSFGALALRRDLGLPRLLVSGGPSGYVTRRMITLAVLAPVALGWLRLTGERRGLYQSDTGTSLMVLVTTAIFIGVVSVLARWLERVEHERRDAAMQLRRSAELTEALARAATVDDVAEVTIRAGLPALGAVSGGLLVASEDGQELRLAAARGFAANVVDSYTTFPVTSPVPAAQAVRTGAPVFIPDVDCYRRDFPAVPQAHLQHAAWAAVPLQGRDRIVGVLALSFGEPQAFAEPQRERLLGLAWQCGQALERALLFDSVTEARRHEQHARESAEHANRAKDEFLAMLGHELRNPLSPILTALHLMKMRADGTLARERAIIERQVRHMVGLVDDLLDVSRITRGTIELKRQRVDVAQLVSAAVEVASPLLEQRAHRLILEVPPELAVVGDQHRLTQVLSNLLTNAAKYTEPGGQIIVRARVEAGELLLSVRDTGVGIAPELLPRVFDLFVQGTRTPDRSAGGLGLGLTIVRRLLEMHGGRVQVASEGPGRGSEFTVRLPLAAAETAAPPPAPGTTRPAAPALPRGRRVLVVDDNRDGAEVLAEALAQAGHDVRVAFDGPSALNLALEFRPQVAFLDIGLPVMDGYDLARRLRAALVGPLTLVAITGYGQPADRASSASAGFDRHLVKPIDLDLAMALAEDSPLAGPAPPPLAASPA